MKKTAFILIVFMLQASTFADVQEITITGTVSSSEDGSAVPGVNVVEKGTAKGTVTNVDGKYSIAVKGESSVLVFSSVGYITEEVRVGTKRIIDVVLQPDITSLEEIVVTGYASQTRRNVTGAVANVSKSKRESKVAYERAMAPAMEYEADYVVPEFNTEGHSAIHENGFLKCTQNPLSTFSIDVDVASYANMRRFLNDGQRPPIDAVRIEEMVNYFNYDYPQPEGEDPFSVNTEIASCPWNEDHKLVHIGLQGLKVPTENLPASNLVFLIDVSGSMQDVNKLPLLKSAFKMLVEELRAEDRVAIVVYAGAAGLVLPSTSGKNKEKIIEALDRLEAGGSTAGGAGIKLAYETALENFVTKGNNRVILASDGDFNVGASSNAEMERLIEQKREQGVFLTVVGFGMGNYKDDKMEIMADKGNGNYAYIDNLQEARKVFVIEFGGTLFTIAKDVKLQIEFNPAKLQAYRLIGYENRRLNDEDFNDDKKDAGELGSGHTVTALYEVIPVGVKSSFIKSVDPLKYQKNQVEGITSDSRDIMTLKLRYKKPDGEKSNLITATVMDKESEWEDASVNFRWSAAVASFGMLLRESEFTQDANLQMVLDLARNSKGNDEEGYRSEFIRLAQASGFLASSK
ncbi:MAG: von Willebrand factor type A domain-containing protein [Cyclobacteriaceae bacterium]|nr:von Willebrand factor type A domain-containing protein [Cyclobacteriaceae bacterium]